MRIIENAIEVEMADDEDDDVSTNLDSELKNMEVLNSNSPKYPDYALDTIVPRNMQQSTESYNKKQLICEDGFKLGDNGLSDLRLTKTEMDSDGDLKFVTRRKKSTKKKRITDNGSLVSNFPHSYSLTSLNIQARKKAILTSLHNSGSVVEVVKLGM